jgi:HEAT repeat protein
MRAEAATALTKIGPAARLVLVAVAKTGPAGARNAATKALGKMGVPAVPELLALLRCEHADTRRAAAEALTPFKAGDRAVVEALADGLQDQDEFVRLRCAEALQEIGWAAKPAVPQLRAVLLDINYNVRWVAFNTLLDIGADPRPFLIRLTMCAGRRASSSKRWAWMPGTPRQCCGSLRKAKTIMSPRRRATH